MFCAVQMQLVSWFLKHQSLTRSMIRLHLLIEHFVFIAFSHVSSHLVSVNASINVEQV